MSREDADRLDELLWTFRDGSFVPHEIAGIWRRRRRSRIIGFQSDSVEGRDLLIIAVRLSSPIAEGFPRVAELVTSDENAKLAGRATLYSLS